jgi:hypothetical protein
MNKIHSFLPKASVTALIVTLSLSDTNSNAATLLQWKTFFNTGTEATELSVFNDSNLTPSTLTLSGVTPAGNANRFGGSNWFDTGDTTTAPGTTLAESISGADYIQFVVTPNALSSYDITEFIFRWDRSNSGPSAVALRSSVDGFDANLGSIIDLPASQSTNQTITVSGLTGLTTATTFRLYGFNATATAGTGGFDTSTDAVNVQLNGLTTVIPEPSRALLLGIGGLCLSFRRRRQ